MYERGLRMMENKFRVAFEAKLNREYREVQGCSFKPKIFTKNSRFNKKEEKKRRMHSEVDGKPKPERFQELYNLNKEREDKL